VASSEQRRRAIVEVVRRQGFAPIDALAQQFAVTPQTIRRDINELVHLPRQTDQSAQVFCDGRTLPQKAVE
jgi:predicted ArsR family transcriptional regulator